MGVSTNLSVIPKILDPLPGGKIMVNAVDFIVNWARSNSLWPLTFGTSCCAIEMMATSMARYDISRFGSEVFRASPRQADLIILAGTIVEKMAEPLQILYEQLPGPKYVIAMGACTISGGPFYYDNYSVVKGADRLIPVDVYVPGCPPRPEALLHGLMLLQEKIRQETVRNPWKEGEINTSPIENRWGKAAEAWKELEKIKDEQESEAREKFKDENPDYQPYKHVRAPKEAFSEIERPQPSTQGLSALQLWETIHSAHPDVSVMGLEEVSAETLASLPAEEPLNLQVDATEYLDVVATLKNNPALDFNFLFEITAVDYPEHFDLMVQLLSMNKGHKVHLHISLIKDPQGDSQRDILAQIPTLCGLYAAAEWKEREVYDFFGIRFTGHPDLRRLFLQDDFVGYPLRKNFQSDAIVKRGY